MPSMPSFHDNTSNNVDAILPSKRFVNFLNFLLLVAPIGWAHKFPRNWLCLGWEWLGLSLALGLGSGVGSGLELGLRWARVVRKP